MLNLNQQYASLAYIFNYNSITSIKILPTTRDIGLAASVHSTYWLGWDGNPYPKYFSNLILLLLALCRDIK